MECTTCRRKMRLTSYHDYKNRSTYHWGCVCGQKQIEVIRMEDNNDMYLRKDNAACEDSRSA